MKDAYLYPAYTLQERAGKPGGGKGALIQINKTGSLQTHCGNDRCVFQPIGVDMYNQTLTGDKSKTMSSKATDSDHIPCAIVPLEGNGSRPSHLGGGYGKEGDNMYTLNTTEVHAVAYCVDQGGAKVCVK